jgi:RNA polymerase sigma-70 factor (ECF subfamily)
LGDDEAGLVRQAQAGDRLAFGRLAERHERGLFRFLVGLVTDADAAEELTQETLIRAWLRLCDLQDPEHLRAWLAAIARNLARRRLTPRRRARTESLDPDLPAPTREPISDEVDGLRRALARLTADEREVLLLFDVEGLSHAEIALITGRSETALRSRLMRARRHLKDLLEAP